MIYSKETIINAVRQELVETNKALGITDRLTDSDYKYLGVIISAIERLSDGQIKRNKIDILRSLENCISKFGEAHNMMARTKLPKEEYQPISSLMATAKVELFNLYYELENKQYV